MACGHRAGRSGRPPPPGPTEPVPPGATVATAAPARSGALRGFGLVPSPRPAPSGGGGGRPYGDRASQAGGQAACRHAPHPPARAPHPGLVREGAFSDLALARARLGLKPRHKRSLCRLGAGQVLGD